MKAKKSNRLLFISSEFTLGGAAYLTIRWIKALNHYYHIDFLICGHTEKRMMDELPPDIDIFQLEPSFWTRTGEKLGQINLGNFSSFLKYKKINVLEESYIAVIATSIFQSWAACASYYLAKSPQKINFLLDERLLNPNPKKHCLNTCINLAILATRDFISVSSDLWSKISNFKDIECEKLAAVMLPPYTEYKSTNKKKLSRLDLHKPMILTIARLDPVKRILESLYLHHELKNQGIDFYWYVVGDGVQENFLSKEIKRLDMINDFILVGFDRDVEWWLKQCDIFALFSQSEGCPTVVIEALQARKLVICTEVNGVAELIKNGKTGLIVPHDFEEIKKHLKSLIVNRNLREKYQKNLLNNLPKNKFSSNVTKMRAIIKKPTSPIEEVVTILIPTFNQASMLERAIDSAINQDYHKLKVVILDDASTDKTKSLCRKWLNNKRFQYVRHKKNIGRVKNYELGLNNYTRGDWVLMLDGDDYLIDHSFISKALKVIRQHAGKEIGFIQAGHRVIYENEIGPRKDILPNIEQKFQLFEPGQYIPFVLNTEFFSHLGLLFNRKLAIKTQAYSNDISSSDMDSFLRLSLLAPVIVFKHIAGAWVQHRANASSKVHVDDIYKNLKIFRYYSIDASRKGLIGIHEWHKPLIKFEAKNIAFLFDKSLGISVNRSYEAFKIFSIACKIYPRLIFHPKIIRTAIKSIFKLSNYNKP